MEHAFLSLPVLSTCACLALLASPARAQFANASSNIPQSGSYTEAVDFADVDLDGDWDAALAEGGDQGPDQNRLWLNQGGQQGGVLGVFVDVTATQIPVLADASRDIDFGDYDGDGDADHIVSNDSSILNQASRFLTNAGGIQAGVSGFFIDETSTRWVGLGGAGSSVSPATLLPGGGFVDWSSESDLADIDNDGDLDLVHTSHGSNFGGQVPTRLFLNDGAGYFSEFNPSGFQLAGTNIANGNPGLWAEGLQQANTPDVTGAFCDIAAASLGVDLADTDGDLDLDLVLNDRSLQPRFLKNLYFENGGVLKFRDTTSANFLTGWVTGGYRAEQEFGDFDGSGTADLLGVNWLSQFQEATYTNSGSPPFGAPSALPSSNNDDQDVETLDYDNDGVLDGFIAAFANTDRLYHGTPAAIAFTYIANSGVDGSSRTLDAAACDVDGDGDYDLLAAEDAAKDEILYANITGVGDTTAPSVPLVQALGAQVAASAKLRVLAHVYDNVPMWLLAHAATVAVVRVDGILIGSFAAKNSGAQLVRAELPGNLVGSVSYRLASSDEHGNAGSSAAQVFSSTTGLAFASSFGTGSPGSLGLPSVRALSVPFAGTTLYLAGENAPPSTAFFLGVTNAPMPGAPLYLPGLGNFNVSGAILLLKSGLTDSSGKALASVPVPAGFPAGVLVYAQFFALDGVGGDPLSSSAGLAITTQ